ncbi:amidase family protein [Nesterenkonia alkaliphila]|uniref:Glutamyl-tRNA amidotransferase n=1 Tax=Nesterenkonia alkaliphila TaxID=1463631 RepID=A0A7K1UJX9_9MICC|nr:amidase family protein [Nesterenkonia alkaliphila]MVT26714.1 glutamyl-tRNA amidotransferase [Nesterenkonia alkaliphila]GFZ76925.1 amidase [Nesterenkonia alkaliphila]
MSTPASTDTYDRSVWRTKGAPLVPAAGTGPLTGETVAVKDLFAVAGHPIGAGNPEFLSQAGPQTHSAPAVQALLEAGAEITGISQTDEFALSLAGTNGHYGTPPNPAAPGRIPGGSSNGSASAVTLGEVSIGLGTDTGGSIRVPAAYQGLWGIRPTHGLVPIKGVHPLAQSFDTVGWLTRTPQLLAAVAEVLVPRPKKIVPSAPSALGGMGTTGSIPTVPKGPVAWEAERPLGRLRTAPSLFGLADPEVTEAVHGLVGRLEQLNGDTAEKLLGPEPELLERWLDEAFQTVQVFEAWANNGAWISRHWEAMTPEVGERYAKAAEVTAEQAAAGRELLAAARETIRSWVADGVLVLPSAASVAPTVEEAEAGSEHSGRVRRRNLLLTSVAGLSGLPAVNVPVTTASGLPAGMSLIGPAGSDKALIRYAVRLAGAQ